MWNEATELEIIMREALWQENIFFAEQVYVRKGNKHFQFDFVVYGECCKIVVECDGPHHQQGERWYKDLLRDLWTVNNDFQDVLRFNRYQLRTNISQCIQAIWETIIDLDNALKADLKRRNKIAKEKNIIRNRKNSLFYKGERPKSPYSGIRVKIPQKSLEQLIEKQKFELLDSRYTFHAHNIYNNRRRELVLGQLKEAQLKLPKPEEPIEVEFGIKIPKREIRYYKLLKNLSIHDKKIIWMAMKSVSKDGFYIFHGHKKTIEHLCTFQLLEVNPFYFSKKNEISVRVLPYAPYLLRAYTSKNRAPS